MAPNVDECARIVRSRCSSSSRRYLAAVLLTVLAVVIGVALLAFAADQFVLGAARIALIRNLSPLVVGVVIIGFGTSCPELLVSAIATVGGKPEIAVGNIVGSNIANLSLLLGIGALIIPLTVGSSTVRREAPITIAAMAAFALAVQGGGVIGLLGSSGMDAPSLAGFASLTALGVSGVVLVMMITRRTIGRLEGMLLIVMYAAFVPFVT